MTDSEVQPIASTALTAEEHLQAKLFNEQMKSLDLEEQLAILPIQIRREELLKKLQAWKRGLADKYEVSQETSRLNLELGTIEVR